MFRSLCRDHHEISAPPLVCARSGYLHTICSGVTQRRGFHHYISYCRLSILGRVFTQIGLTALPSRRFLQISCPQSHNSASHATRFHAESGSGYLLMMLELIFHWTWFPSADFSHLSSRIRKRSAGRHRQDHNDHSPHRSRTSRSSRTYSSRSRLVHDNLLLPLQARGESPHHP